jgi:hypothetical protein
MTELIIFLGTTIVYHIFSLAQLKVSVVQFQLIVLFRHVMEKSFISDQSQVQRILSKSKVSPTVWSHFSVREIMKTKRHTLNR